MSHRSEDASTPRLASQTKISMKCRAFTPGAASGGGSTDVTRTCPTNCGQLSRSCRPALLSANSIPVKAARQWLFFSNDATFRISSREDFRASDRACSALGASRVVWRAGHIEAESAIQTASQRGGLGHGCRSGDNLRPTTEAARAGNQIRGVARVLWLCFPVTRGHIRLSENGLPIDTG